MPPENRFGFRRFIELRLRLTGFEGCLEMSTGGAAAPSARSQGSGKRRQREGAGVAAREDDQEKARSRHAWSGVKLPAIFGSLALARARRAHRFFFRSS